MRAAAGDTEAASALLREFHRPVFAYFRRLPVSEADAADLTQATFLKVWQSIGRFRGASSFFTWVHRIAYCTYVDWLRKLRQPAEQSDDWWTQLPAAGPTPLESAGDAETSRRVYAAVERLPEDFRQVIHLRYYQGLSLADTAEVLDLAKSTLRYRLQSALDQLQVFLQEPAPKNNQTKET